MSTFEYIPPPPHPAWLEGNEIFAQLFVISIMIIFIEFLERGRSILLTVYLLLVLFPVVVVWWYLDGCGAMIGVCFWEWFQKRNHGDVPTCSCAPVPTAMPTEPQEPVVSVSSALVPVVLPVVHVVSPSVPFEPVVHVVSPSVPYKQVVPVSSSLCSAGVSGPVSVVAAVPGVVSSVGDAAFVGDSAVGVASGVVVPGVVSSVGGSAVVDVVPGDVSSAVRAFSVVAASSGFAGDLGVVTATSSVALSARGDVVVAGGSETKDKDVDDLCSAFKKLDVFDPMDEDTYMRPPIDVRYEEPLWLTRLLEVQPMDTTEDVNVVVSSPLVSSAAHMPSPFPIAMDIDNPSPRIPFNIASPSPSPSSSPIDIHHDSAFIMPATITTTNPAITATNAINTATTMPAPITTTTTNTATTTIATINTATMPPTTAMNTTTNTINVTNIATSSIHTFTPPPYQSATSSSTTNTFTMATMTNTLFTPIMPTLSSLSGRSKILHNRATNLITATPTTTSNSANIITSTRTPTRPPSPHPESSGSNHTPLSQSTKAAQTAAELLAMWEKQLVADEKEEAEEDL